MAFPVATTTTKAKRVLEVRLAENQLEIERTLALRYEIFNLEMNEGLAESAQTGKDRDEYDLFCDHLIVLDKTDPAEEKIVGTYRMLRRRIADQNIGFYTENEFDLSEVRKLEGEIAEIGRSCVHPDYRDGSVINMLWVGIGNYLKTYDVQYLMGCGSVHSHDPREASLICAWLREKGALVDEHMDVEPRPGYEVEGFDPELKIDDPKALNKKIPALIKGYIRAGSKLGGKPAYDHEFGTIDFFILFDRADIDKRYNKHYIERD